MAFCGRLESRPVEAWNRDSSWCQTGPKPRLQPPNAIHEKMARIHNRYLILRLVAQEDRLPIPRYRVLKPLRPESCQKKYWVQRRSSTGTVILQRPSLVRDAEPPNLKHGSVRYGVLRTVYTLGSWRGIGCTAEAGALRNLPFHVTRLGVGVGLELSAAFDATSKLDRAG